MQFTFWHGFYSKIAVRFQIRKGGQTGKRISRYNQNDLTMANRMIKNKSWSLIKILAIAAIVSLVAVASAGYYFNYSKKQNEVNRRTDNKSSMSYVPTLQMLASLMKFVRS